MNLKIFFISFLFLACSDRTSLETKNKKLQALNNPKSVQFANGLNLEKGHQIYLYRCASCHQKVGEGVSGVYPPLANSDWLKKDVKTQAISSVKNGKKGVITVNGVNYNGVMPALALSDLEIAQVLTFIYQALNQLPETVTEAEVKSVNSKTFSGK